ncbi:MAG TPA: N-acetylmuramoyl-L-alanine amidase [Beutenbergiaceae bacterium]|nr:N-acetylmuramoyl-L-alanine amidase [Beutenbergiaceae bacterium]
MAWMQGARRRPIRRNYTARVTEKDCIILHVTGAPNATSQHGWFNTRGAGASSHFHVDLAGNIEQYIDTAYMSWANREGNPRSVTIETQGGANGAWTTAQVRAIRTLIQWIRQHHKGIPLRQMTSSFRSQKGIGWHRLGCNGNFPRTGILRGRNQRGGGELWSGAYGKVCPGSDRIRQIPAIIRQAGGHWTPATTDQANRQQARSWFDMATKNDLRQVLREERVQPWLYKGKNEDWDTYAYLRKTHSLLEKLYDNVGRRVWSYKNHLTDTDIYAFLRATHRQVMAAQGERDGLMKAIEQISQGKEINLEEIRKATQQGVSDALGNLEADVTLHVDASEITE